MTAPLPAGRSRFVARFAALLVVVGSLSACGAGAEGGATDGEDAGAADAGSPDSGGPLSDAAVASDAEAGPDLATSPDAAVSPDAALSPDAAVAADTAGTTDIAAAPDTTPDAGLEPDGGAGGDVTGACQSSADCVQASVGCVASACIDGVCTPQKRADGTPCSDGKPCTTAASCKGGECVASETVDCDDGNPCTEGTCQPATGACEQAPRPKGTPCDDGKPCTEGTVCDAASGCGGGVNACGCTSIKDCAAFDDGDPCNGTLYCNDKLPKPACEVLPASVVICDPAQDGPCARTACNPATGHCELRPRPDGVPCEDGNPCTASTTCQDGACAALVNTCQCQASADCLKHEDGNACNGTLYCDTSKLPYTCRVNPGSIPTCKPVTAPCKVSACDPATGACAVRDAPDGSPCSDGLDKTIGDACKAGACVPGIDTSQCKTSADCAAHEDGDFCNGTMFCNADTGRCRVNPATIVSCPSVDDTDCRRNTCNPKSGLCEPVAAPAGTSCDDGNACTVGEVCAGTECVPSADVCQCKSDGDCKDKDDGDLCNGTLYCDKPTGTCKLNAATVVSCPTVDDTACRKAACVPKTGECALHDLPAAAACDDGDPCTAGDACAEGVCTGTRVCACSSDADCASQDDGDLCNGTLYCDKKAGKCVTNPATLKVCPTVDDTECARSRCRPKTGKCALEAVFTGAKCDADGNPCTAHDYCDGGVCKPGKSVCGCWIDADCDGKQGEDKCVVSMVCDKATFTCKPAKTVECATDGDTPCRTTRCDPATGKCAERREPDGTICGESAICAGAQICKAGACVAGPASDCDDADPCTADTCDAEKGCRYAPRDSGACDDGNVCTEADHCSAGNCVGTARDCSDETPCTDDACDPDKGCVHLANAATSCDDGDVCRSGDFCFGGRCIGGAKLLVCDDGNPCTDDSCDPKQGCVSAAAADKPCDDGDACTSKDRCKAGACRGEQRSCDDGSLCTKDSCSASEGCVHQALTGQPCDDGNACTSGDRCIFSGLCASGRPRVCDDNNPCTADLCDPLQGCVFKVGGAKPCDDGNACFVNDRCIKGKCVGSPRDCDDGLVCSKDTCDSLAGCRHAVTAGTPCDDGNKCTGGDRCAKSGACVPGPGLDCNDGNGCTTDRCDPVAGCTHKALDGIGCDDGDGCTTADACTKGVCKGRGKSCDDGLECTVDDCEKAGGCTHAPRTGKACSDDNACTLGDRCLASGYCKPGTRKSCDDGNACTADACTPGKGCVHSPRTGVACDDGNACTGGETCTDKALCVGSPVSCDDGLSCTRDTCDNKAGCRHVVSSVACEDGNKCTVGDKCLPSGACAPGPSRSCEDHNPCTADTCSAAKGCEHKVLDKADCEDGSACTVGDRCAGAKCVGSPRSCDDSQSCTKDGCDQAKGCVHTALAGASCDDGNKCTSGDKCSKAGTCAPGAGLNCDDGKPCTADGCDAATGCTHKALSGIACNDGNACTKADSCSAGVCKGAPVVCDDGNPCTKNETCKPATGCSYTPLAGTGCSDGNECTGGDKCDKAGRCAGTKKSCDDKNPCTVDTCDVNTGCLNTKLQGAACDDGKPCTVRDACAAGQCAGKDKTCDDANPCTTDSCNAANGACRHVANTIGCDDGNACTESDKCSGRKCAGAKINCSDANDCTTDTCNKVIGCLHALVADGSACSDGDDCTVNWCNGSGTCMARAKLWKRTLQVGYAPRDMRVASDGSLVLVGDTGSKASGAFFALLPMKGKVPNPVTTNKIRTWDRIGALPGGGYVAIGHRPAVASAQSCKSCRFTALAYAARLTPGGAVIRSYPLMGDEAPARWHTMALRGKTAWLVGARAGHSTKSRFWLAKLGTSEMKPKWLKYWKLAEFDAYSELVVNGIVPLANGNAYALVMATSPLGSRSYRLRITANGAISATTVWSQPRIFGGGIFGAEVVYGRSFRILPLPDGGFELHLASNKRRRLDATGNLISVYTAMKEGPGGADLLAPRGNQLLMVRSNGFLSIYNRPQTAKHSELELPVMPSILRVGPERNVYLAYAPAKDSGVPIWMVERRDPYGNAVCTGCLTKVGKKGCATTDAHLDKCDVQNGKCVRSVTPALCDDGNPCTMDTGGNAGCKHTVSTGKSCSVNDTVCQVAAAGKCLSTGRCGRAQQQRYCSTANKCRPTRCNDMGTDPKAACIAKPPGSGMICSTSSIYYACVKTSCTYTGYYYTHTIGAKSRSIPTDGSNVVLTSAIGCGSGNRAKKLKWLRVRLNIGERTGPYEVVLQTSSGERKLWATDSKCGGALHSNCLLGKTGTLAFPDPNRPAHWIDDLVGTAAFQKLRINPKPGWYYAPWRLVIRRPAPCTGLLCPAQTTAKISGTVRVDCGG